MERRCFPRLNAQLRALPDGREAALCEYSPVALCRTPLLMYLGRLGARRQIRHRLRTPGVKVRLEGLCGEALPAVPDGDTVANYLDTVAPAALQAVVQAMVRDLLEARRLEDFRLLGQYYLLTCDLTGHLYLGEGAVGFTDGALTQETPDGRTLYYRPVCEAKLVTRTGLALSVGSEFVENPPGFDPARDTQDSELPAAERLLARVKTAFPGYAFCALLDARYCNETGFALCERHGWRFIITLKEGSLPSVWNEFQTLRRLRPQNRRRVIRNDIAYEYTWVNDIAYGTRTLHVLECRWTDRQGEHCFVWVTDIRLSADHCEALAQEGGRGRWKTENEGFRAQKHGGFALEHAYARRPTAARNFYLLLQIAHLESQLIEGYCKGKQAVKRLFGSLRNLAAALLEALRCDPIPDDETLRRFLDEPIQIRLNSG
jgi:hypothetical protein